MTDALAAALRGDWLPEGVPQDLPRWPLVGLRRRHGTQHVVGLVYGSGTLAYELVCATDGRAVEIIEWLDGHQIRHWRRDPITGTWPGTYVWRLVDEEPESCLH